MPPSISSASEENVSHAYAGGEDDSPDLSLMTFLAESDELAHLSESFGKMTWDECDELCKQGRPKLLSALGKLGKPSHPAGHETGIRQAACSKRI